MEEVVVFCFEPLSASVAQVMEQDRVGSLELQKSEASCMPEADARRDGMLEVHDCAIRSEAVVCFQTGANRCFGHLRMQLEIILPLLTIHWTRSLLAGAVESFPTAATLQLLFRPAHAGRRVRFDGV